MEGPDMSNNELELLKIIHENDNPCEAVLTAIEVFTAFLTQLGADPVQQAVCPQESA